MRLSLEIEVAKEIDFLAQSTSGDTLDLNAHLLKNRVGNHIVAKTYFAVQRHI